jgi:N-acetylglucosaminyldiphosphoundecaprenol N-acetyl-beta-D-mannosaminyltransferase
MNKPYNIVISGWYGQLNAGDDAILDVFVQQATARSDCTVTVLSEAPHNLPPAPRRRALMHPVAFGKGTLAVLFKGVMWRHMKLIRDCDLFVLGGGGLLRDNTNWRNLVRLLDEIWIARLFGRKTMLYAIGVGPFKTRLGKWLIGASVRMCDLVTVRSERCASLLRDIGVPAERIHVVADPAFLLTSDVPQDPVIRALFSPAKKRVGFYPTFALLMDYHDENQLRQLAAGLDGLVESHGVEIVAVPMSVLNNGLDDVRVAQLVQGFMRHPQAMTIYEHQLTAQELKWVTAQALMNVTVRLHAMIFSLGANVPVVAVNYEPKVANVFADFGAPEYLVEMDQDLDRNLAAAAGRCIDNLDAYTEQIRDRRNAVSANSARTFELMRALDSNAHARTGAPNSDKV